MGCVNSVRDLSVFPLAAAVDDPKGTLSALLGVHIAGMHDLVRPHHGERQATLLCQSC